MSQLSHLLKHDFTLLNRNNVIAISVIVTVIYMGVFQALATLPNAEQLLVLIIFIDPVLLGFLFVGVMVLFEKNEHTIQALAVSPVSISNYILSKSSALTLISMFCCFAMMIVGYGWGFNMVHFAMACILTTLIFAFVGFVAIAGQSSINKFILRVLLVVIVLSLPFLGYFDLLPKYWFVLFPSTPAIELFDLSFQSGIDLKDMIWPYLGSIAWCFIMYRWARYMITKTFAK